MDYKELFESNKKNIIIIGLIIVIFIVIIGVFSGLSGSSTGEVLEIITTTSSVQIEETKTYQVKYTILPSELDETYITWTTTNEEVATVNETGLITAIEPGSAVIVAKAKSGAYANIDVIVVEKDKLSTTVSFNIENFDLKINTSRTLNLIFEPSTPATKSVSWESSNDLVATVSPTGTITGVKTGKAVITATIALKNGNYMSTSSNVTVTKATTLSLSKVSSISIENGSTGVYYLVVSDESVTVKQIAGSESNNNIVQIIRRPIANSSDNTISFIIKGMGIGESELKFDMETTDGEVVSLTVPVKVKS